MSADMVEIKSARELIDALLAFEAAGADLNVEIAAADDYGREQRVRRLYHSVYQTRLGDYVEYFMVE